MPPGAARRLSAERAEERTVVDCPARSFPREVVACPGVSSAATTSRSCAGSRRATDARTDVPLHRRRRRRRVALRRKTAAFDSVEFLPRRSFNVSTISHVDHAIGSADRLALPSVHRPHCSAVPSRGRGRYRACRARERDDLSLSSVSVGEIQDARSSRRGRKSPGLHVQGSGFSQRVRAAREGIGLRRAEAHRRRHRVRQSRARHRHRHDGAAEVGADEPVRHRDEAEVGDNTSRRRRSRWQHRAPTVARQRKARRHHSVPERCANRSQRYLERGGVDHQGVGRRLPSRAS